MRNAQSLPKTSSEAHANKGHGDYMTTTKQITDYLTVEQAAYLLGLKLSRIRHMIFRKQIPYIKIGASIRFDKTELKNWINTKAIKADE